jgi:predicted ArsR family transcriptional regulator
MSKDKNRFPAKPNTRTVTNLRETALALSDFRTVNELAEVLGIDYQAAAERLRMVKASGRFVVESKPGIRPPGRRGALPTLYKVTDRQPELPAPEQAPESTPAAG